MRLNNNRKGGAAIVAVLIVIMLVCVGTAALIVTGRQAIADVKPADASAAESSSGNNDGSSNIDASSSEADVPNEEPSVYPVQSASYKEINDKDITGKYSILLNANSGEIIAGKNYDRKIYPASLTKMLTLLVAAENIKDLNATYTFKATDIDPLIEENASRAGFEVGEKVTMKDLIYSSVLVSGADGTTGLANSISGSEKEFVKLMNNKITELGLTGTEFVNASGLHNKNHFSTVQDMAVITRECLNNEICKKVLSTSAYRTSKTKQNPNGIRLDSIVLSRFEGYYIDLNGDEKADAKILGGKSGFTDEASFTLSTICEYKGNYYICVTAKVKNQDLCSAEQIAIYEKYLPKTDAADTVSDSKTDSKAS